LEKDTEQQDLNPEIQANQKFCPVCDTRYDESVLTCEKDDHPLVFVKQDSMLDRVIDGRFRITQVLGRGGMGAVYKAIQLSINRFVALKILKEELALKEDFLKRFYREVNSISKLNHPNIVSVIDFGQSSDGYLYIVMEFIEGESLRRKIDFMGHMPLITTLDIIYQICDALTEAHSKQIVHRDLKPENVITYQRGSRNMIKILDFGISKIVGATPITLSGTFLGTPEYIPTEAILNQAIDHCADIYALGIMTYEMLTGRTPFFAEEPERVMFRQINEIPRPFSEAKPEKHVPHEVEQLVFKMLEKDPRKRPQSSEEIMARIEEIKFKIKMDIISSSDAFEVPSPITYRVTSPGMSKKLIDVDQVDEAMLIESKTADTGIFGDFGGDDIIEESADEGLITEKEEQVSTEIRKFYEKRRILVPMFAGIAMVFLAAGIYFFSRSENETVSSTEKNNNISETSIGVAKPADGAGLNKADPGKEETPQAKTGSSQANQKETAQPEKPAAEQMLSLSPPVVVISQPHGADVMINGKIVGRTPFEISGRKQGESIDMTIQLTGYQSRNLTVSSSDKGEIKVNLKKAVTKKKTDDETKGLKTF
jgi:serine/threonine protein kinase